MLKFCLLLKGRSNFQNNPTDVTQFVIRILQKVNLKCIYSCFHSNLSTNHLSRLEESGFAGLSLLDELDVGNNRVSFIADGAFRGLSNLQML